jgi:hypothetical protein
VEIPFLLLCCVLLPPLPAEAQSSSWKDVRCCCWGRHQGVRFLLSRAFSPILLRLFRSQISPSSLVVGALGVVFFAALFSSTVFSSDNVRE